MITFTVIFGLSSANYAKFACNDDLMNFFGVNKVLNNHSKLVLNFALDKFRARYSARLKAVRKLCHNLEDEYQEDRELAEEWWGDPIKLGSSALKS